MHTQSDDAQHDGRGYFYTGKPSKTDIKLILE